MVLVLSVACNDCSITVECLTVLLENFDLLEIFAGFDINPYRPAVTSHYQCPDIH